MSFVIQELSVLGSGQGIINLSYRMAHSSLKLENFFCQSSLKWNQSFTEYVHIEAEQPSAWNP